MKSYNNHMTILLDDFLDLKLDCHYHYEPPAPEDEISPPELAVVSLERIYLGIAQLEIGMHLSVEQWSRLEQEIYDRIEQEG